MNLTAVVLAAALMPVTAASVNPTPPPAVLGRLIALSDDVKSYTANVRADVAMHTFPYLSPTLDGTYYHKEPSKDKVVFTSGLPFMAKEFSKVYPHVESPSRWEDVFLVTVESNNGTDTMLKLVPRKHGRVDHIDATIDDQTAELVGLRWNYNDGGYATLSQTYGNVDGHELVTQQTGHFEVPHYTADMKSTFSDFNLNADIPDSVFSQNG